MIGLTLKGPTLGDTIYRSLLAAAVLGILAMVLFSLIFGKWASWRAGTWKERAQEANQAAQAAQANANSANAGAANAAETRDRIDLHVDLARSDTQASAGRIEDHEPTDVVPAGAPDDDVLLELEAGENQYRAAADRLQRKRAGRATPKGADE